MAGLIPSSSDCCTPCIEPVSVAIPGPQGDPAEPCEPCIDGVSAFTTANSFVMPAELANVTVTVVNSDWMTSGQIVWAKGGGAQGFFEVQSKPDSTHVILKNLEDTASSAYTSNSPPATVFPALTEIVAAGIQGPQGAAAASPAPVDATYITQTPNGTLTSEQALNGIAAGGDAYVKVTQATGVLAKQVPPIPIADGGTAATTAAGARTALGLGTVATQDSTALTADIIGGSIIGAIPINTSQDVACVNLLASSSGETKLNGKLFTAPSAIQSLLAATAISPNAGKVRVVGNGGAVTLTATPTITSPVDDGQLLLVMGTSDANTVTLQDEASLAGTKLQLGAATRLLGAGDHILLSWDATNSFWYEVAFTNL